MPHNKNQYDSTWRDTWITKSNKQIWLYQGIFYNPPHTTGEKAPFAGAWAMRRKSRTNSILSLKEWTRYFGRPLKDLNNIQRKPGGYGIDERMLLNFFQSKKFEKNTFIVGITWILYLFNSQINPRDFTRMPDVQRNKVILIKEHDMINTLYTYLSEIRCILLYIMSTSGHGKTITIRQLWDLVNNWKIKLLHETNTQDLDSVMISKVFYKLLALIPEKRYLWDVLFEGQNDEDTPVMSILTSFGLNVNYDNMCDIIPKYFSGGKFNYDDYITLDFGKIPLPTKDIGML